jgi:hypothetical protein
VIGSCTLDQGVCTPSHGYDGLSVGDHTIYAVYGGATGFAASTSTGLTVKVAKANQTISFDPLAGKTYGDHPFGVSATATSGLPVSIVASPHNVCTDYGPSIIIRGVGDCTVTASQPGNSNFNAAPIVSHSFRIAKAATSTELASSTASLKRHRRVTFIATVESPAGTPSGRVAFFDDVTDLCTASLNADGVATCTVVLPVRRFQSHGNMAIYGGDRNFEGSTSPVLELTVR